MMRRSKLILITLAILMLSSMTQAFQNSKFPTEHLNIKPEMPKIRNLESSHGGEGLIATLYSEHHYKGTAFEILSGATTRLQTETISLKVGEATLRIIDFDNKWVYRFAPGEYVQELNLKTRNWVATLGKPRVDEDCVMFFQRPNYSGYFEVLCLTGENEWVNGELFDKRFTSFTLPENNKVKFVAILGKMSEVQVFNFRSAFSGDLNYVYLFGDIPDNRAFIFTAKTYSRIELIPEAAAIEVTAGPYFLVSGKHAYAKLTEENNSVVFSKDRQFVLHHVRETATAQGKDLTTYPENGSVLLFNNEDGFGPKQVVEYEAVDAYPVVEDAKYIIFPADGVSAVAFGFENEDHCVTMRDSGRIPNENNAKISRIALAPSVIYNRALLFTSRAFRGESFIADQGEKYGTSDSIESIVVGYGTEVFFVSEDKKDIVTYKSGNIFVEITPLSGYVIFYDKNSMLQFITPTNCVYLFDSCEQFYAPQVICENDSESYKDIVNINQVALVAFPADHSKIYSVLIYHSDTFDGQFNFVQSTCLKRSPNHDQKITIVPRLEDNTVAYYDDIFYSGRKHLLKNDVVTEIYDPTVERISIALGKGGNLKIIDLQNRKVFHINFNTVKLHTHQNDYFLQAGHLPVVNEKHALWTFDDDMYSDMRILHGGVYYGESAVSHLAQYIVFPSDESTQTAILVDRRNSLIQTYRYQEGLIPVDHTTFGGVERIITVPKDWDNVLLCRYADFGEFKAKFGRSEIVKLGNNRHYSFITQGTEDLRIFSWPLLNNLKYDPKDAIVTYPAEQLIERSLTVGLTGVYGFVVGNENPINVLYDCIITFDDCDNQSNIRRWCMRSRGIGLSTFEIPTRNISKLSVLVTHHGHQFVKNVKRKYAGVLFDETYFMDKTECLSVPNDSYKFQFITHKP